LDGKFPKAKGIGNKEEGSGKKMDVPTKAKLTISQSSADLPPLLLARAMPGRCGWAGIGWIMKLKRVDETRGVDR
jgi:hypothetical protein